VAEEERLDSQEETRAVISVGEGAVEGGGKEEEEKTEERG
jgi:hypothetical protein